jgi:hypothetical protein
MSNLLSRIANASHATIGSWTRLFCAPLLVLGLLGAASGASAQTTGNTFQAFYYDSFGKLLQVEDVPNSELTKRKLVHINDAVVPIPMLTPHFNPLIVGTKIPMSKFATLAVYYSYDGTPQPGDQNVQAKPKRVEYLGFVPSRVLLRCLPRDPSAPCLFPKRCHCMTGSCCCY